MSLDTLGYQYLVGTLVFGAGLVLAWRQGYVGVHGRGRGSLVVLVGGLLGFAMLQSYLQYGEMSEAPPGPAYTGPPPAAAGDVTGLDYVVIAVYFAAILALGIWAGRRQRTLDDYFFAGRRFAWWLVAFSLVATVVGSYSFVKYSRVGFEHGLASSQTYLNDWFWMPLFWFSWLPLLYFSGVGSIPEYFARRFGARVRACVTGVLLVYLIGYVGVNLFTMGTALHFMLGWPILASAGAVALISGLYVTAGGQSSVIITDLFQGVMLLVAGIVIIALGAAYVGGLDELWLHLPREHRRAFSHFNRDPSFPGVGIFWQDGIANTAMFYFLNQGVIMRFLAARHVQDGRRAMLVVPLVLMPVAACVVASGGWVGRALVHAGALPVDLDPKEAFYVATRLLSTPGIYGFVLATLTAALMSTIDTLITGAAAIIVNDVYRPYLRPHASEAACLRAARWTAVGVTLLGLALVPVYMGFRSIYAAHGAFTAAVTPPLVATFLLALGWRGMTASGALAGLVGGIAAIAASVVWPDLVAPFAHGVAVTDPNAPGLQQHTFMRALYGLVISGAAAIGVSWLTRASSPTTVDGLVWGTVGHALRRYLGRPGDEFGRRAALVAWRPLTSSTPGTDATAVVSTSLARTLDCRVGDRLYISDRRAWLGGLRSTHARVGEVIDDDPNSPPLSLGASVVASVGVRSTQAVRVEHHYVSEPEH